MSVTLQNNIFDFTPAPSDEESTFKERVQQGNEAGGGAAGGAGGVGETCSTIDFGGSNVWDLVDTIGFSVSFISVITTHLIFFVGVIGARGGSSQYVGGDEHSGPRLWDSCQRAQKV